MPRMTRDRRVCVVTGVSYPLWRRRMLRIVKSGRVSQSVARHLVRHRVYLSTVRPSRAATGRGGICAGDV